MRIIGLYRSKKEMGVPMGVETTKVQGFDVYLAWPRGFCAGVDRAIEIVRLALQLYGPPVYVRHAIVHNRKVVSDLAREGAVFVEDIEEIPEGSVVIFSAHGVSPAVRQAAAKRNLRVIDATCPLVTKVHLEARRYAQEGYTILYIGHAGHVEVEGTMGVAPEHTILIQNPEDAHRVQPPNPDKVAVLTQTTLSVDETQEILAILQQRFPKIRKPHADDICYATQNRQDIVKVLAQKTDVVLVFGSQESSNSNRLREVAECYGARSYLIENIHHVDLQWLVDVQAVGVTAGASTPEEIVQEGIQHLLTIGQGKLIEIQGKTEQITFQLPPPLVKEALQAGVDLPE